MPTGTMPATKPTAHNGADLCKPDSVEPVRENLVSFPTAELAETENLDRLEEALVEAFPGLDLDELITHRFSNGVYAREMVIPAGVITVSMVHKVECISTCSAGRIWVWTAGTGEGFNLIEAPYTAVTPPGTRRVGIAEADTVWTTFHATDSEDVDEIEKTLYDARSLERREALGKRTKELAEARRVVPAMIQAMHDGEMDRWLEQH